MDPRMSFEDSFHFDESMSCPSSTGSFSVGSASEAYTPTSGRSTPAQRIRLDFDNMPCSGSIAYDLTPPASAFSTAGYFPQDIKNSFSDILDCDPMSSTPSRKSSVQTPGMDFDYQPMYHHLPSVDSSNTHLLGHFPYADQYSTTHFPQNNGFSLDVMACHDASVWAGCPDTSPASFFGGLPSPIGHMPVHHNKRRLHLEDVQQKSTALHRVQQGRLGKRDRNMDFIRIPQGMYRCDFPECATRRPFKRQEHLKRHKETKHKVDGVIFSCPFCSKTFNRRDNYRSHLLLHTKKDRTISRTRYDPRALALYEEEMRNTKHRNFLKKKKVNGIEIDE